jgi:hypothetical protein
LLKELAGFKWPPKESPKRIGENEDDFTDKSEERCNGF